MRSITPCRSALRAATSSAAREKSTAGLGIAARHAQLQQRLHPNRFLRQRCVGSRRGRTAPAQLPPDARFPDAGSVHPARLRRAGRKIPASPVRYCTGSLARRRFSKVSNCSACWAESKSSGWVSKAVGSHPSTWDRMSSASRRGYWEVEASRARAACSTSPAVAGTLRHSGCFSLETLGLVVSDEGIDGRL